MRTVVLGINFGVAGANPVDFLIARSIQAPRVIPAACAAFRANSRASSSTPLTLQGLMGFMPNSSMTGSSEFHYYSEPTRVNRIFRRCLELSARPVVPAGDGAGAQRRNSRRKYDRRGRRKT